MDETVGGNVMSCHDMLISAVELLEGATTGEYKNWTMIVCFTTVGRVLLLGLRESVPSKSCFRMMAVTYCALDVRISSPLCWTPVVG